MRKYNDDHGVELSCNRVTIKISVKFLLEGGGKTLQMSTITVSDTRQYVCHWKVNIYIFKTVQTDLLRFLCTLKNGLPFPWQYHFLFFCYETHVRIPDLYS